MSVGFDAAFGRPASRAGVLKGEPRMLRRDGFQMLIASCPSLIRVAVAATAPTRSCKLCWGGYLFLGREPLALIA